MNDLTNIPELIFKQTYYCIAGVQTLSLEHQHILKICLQTVFTLISSCIHVYYGSIQLLSNLIWSYSLPNALRSVYGFCSTQRLNVPSCSQSGICMRTFSSRKAGRLQFNLPVSEIDLKSFLNHIVFFAHCVQWRAVFINP